MIPFTLFQARLYGPGMHVSEVRALELSPDGFTFRLPGSFSPQPDEISGVSVRFVHVRSNEARCLKLSDYKISAKEHEAYYTVLRLCTADEAFRAEAVRLSREYLSYIEAKLALEDAALTHQYFPEYPAEERISEPDGGGGNDRTPETDAGSGDDRTSEGGADAADGRTSGADEDLEGPPASETSPGALGVVLRTPSERERWLQSAAGSFLLDYFSSHDIPDIALKNCELRYLYVGDAFCPLLFPTEAEFQPLIQKAKEDSLSLVFLLAPVPESMLENFCKAVTVLASALESSEMKAEIEVGDVGMLRFCERLSPYLEAFSGILMHKKLKDPRMRYMEAALRNAIDTATRNATDTATWNATDTDTWNATDTDTWNATDTDTWNVLDVTEHAVYLPYYQTNTATFCTLQAVLRHGNRSAGQRITHCALDCENTFFRYPDHLHMIGRGNSLFGYCREALEHTDRIRDNKAKRLVLNF